MKRDMKKVLIVSYTFPPHNHIAAKRYGIMCKYMPEYGYEPYVLTCNIPNKYNTGRAKPLNTGLSERFMAQNVLRIGKMYQTKVNSMFWILILDCLKYFKLNMRGFDELSLSWFQECKKQWKCIESIGKPDLVLATYPFAGNIYVAKYLSQKWNIPYIVEFRDLLSEYSEVEQDERRFVWGDYCIERYLLHNAKALIGVTKGFCKVLCEHYNKPITVIYNGHDTEAYTPSLQDENEYLYYAGSLYGYMIPGFYLLFEVLKKISEKQKIIMKIRISGGKNHISKLKSFIRKKKLEDLIEILPECSAEQAQEERKKALINVVLGDIREKKDLQIVIPAKLMELISVGRPILAISSEKAEMAGILNRTKKGIATSDQIKIYEFIMDRWGNFKGEARQIFHYSRKTQCRKLCHFLNQVLFKSNSTVKKKR